MFSKHFKTLILMAAAASVIVGSAAMGVGQASAATSCNFTAGCQTSAVTGGIAIDQYVLPNAVQCTQDWGGSDVINMPNMDIGHAGNTDQRAAVVARLYEWVSTSTSGYWKLDVTQPEGYTSFNVNDSGPHFIYGSSFTVSPGRYYSVNVSVHWQSLSGSTIGDETVWFNYQQFSASGSATKYATNSGLGYSYCKFAS
jgi:hypothetical protein